MESRGVLLEKLNKVSCIHFVKKRGAILEIIDIDFFNRSSDDFLAALFDYLLNIIVFSASLVVGFCFFNSTTVASFHSERAGWGGLFMFHVGEMGTVIL